MLYNKKMLNQTKNANFMKVSYFEVGHTEYLNLT